MILRKIAIYISYLIVIFLLLILLLFFYLKTETGQNKARPYVTNQISKALDTPVDVGYVNIQFWKDILLKDIAIKGKSGNHIASIEEAKVTFSLFTFFGKQVSINEILLSKADIHLVSDSLTSNYQHILDKLKKRPSTNSKKEPTDEEWDIDLSKIKIQESQFIQESENSILTIEVKKFTGKLSDFDSKFESINFESIDAEGLHVKMIETMAGSQNHSITTFPTLPFSLQIGTLDIEDSYIVYDKSYIEEIAEEIDPNHLAFNNLNLKANDFRWGRSISGEIKSLSFDERSGFSLDDVSTAIHLTPNSLGVNEFKLKTSESEIVLNMKTEYKSLNELLTDFLKTKTQIDITKGNFSGNDIRKIVGSDLNNSINFKIIDQINYMGNLSFENGVYTSKRSKLIINDEVKADLKFRYKDYSKYYNAEILSFSIEYEFLKKLLPSVTLPNIVKDLGNVSGKMIVEGGKDIVTFEQLDIISTKGHEINGYGSIKNFDSKFGPIMDFHLNSLNSDINVLLKKDENLPQQIYSLGQFSFNGDFKGDLYSFLINGNASTELGDIKLNSTFDFNDDYSDAVYDGFFDIQELDLGVLLQDTTFGPTTIIGTIKGTGLTIDLLDANLKAKAPNVFFDGKVYKEIFIDGTFADKEFEGQFDSKDKNLQLSFNGRSKIDGINTEISFESELSEVDLSQFGIGTEKLKISGSAIGIAKGNNIDNFVGEVVIENFCLRTKHGIYNTKNPVRIESTDNGEKKTYSLSSDFLEGEIIGNIKLSQLSKVLEQYLQSYVPLEYGYENSNPWDSIQNQKFQIDLKTKEISSLIQTVLGPHVDLKNGKISGSFDTDNSKINLKGSIDSLKYNDLLVKKTDYFFDGRGEFINGNILISEIYNKKDIIVHTADVNSQLNSKIGNVNIELLDIDDEQVLLTGFDVSQREDYVFTIHKELLIDQETWIINKHNEINYGINGLYIGGLDIKKDKQNITIFTNENENGLGIEVLLDYFKISELSKLIDSEKEDMAGIVNGVIIVNSIFDKPFITSQLSVDDIKINKNNLGNLVVNAIQEPNSNSVKSTITLTGLENDAVLKFDYDIVSSKLKGRLNMTSLKLVTLDPFIKDVIKDSNGHLVGSIDISGTFNQPKLEGTIFTKNIETTPVFTNSRLKIADAPIRLYKDKIDLGSLKINDVYNNEAKLSGNIHYQSLNNMNLNLKLATGKFNFLNTTSVENPLFYGNINVDGYVFISGPLESILIEGQIKAVDNSTLTLSPFSSNNIDYNSEFIIFEDPREVSLDSLGTRKLIARKANPFDLNVKISVDETSTFNMIMDPVTGDKIYGSGIADLSFRMTQAGDMNMYGTYTVSKGEYLFSYGIISKEFKISEGSQVIFNGDPLDGQLKVSAKYPVSTPVYDLLQAEITTLTENQVSETKQNKNIFVVLNLNESILKPKITMDIERAEDDFTSTAVASAMENKFNQLKSNTNEMNNQVFGLLLFNNFVSLNALDTEIAKSGTDIAFKSISGMVTQQLNKLSDGLIKGFDLNFDVNSYSSNYLSDGQEGLVTELGVGISKKLFNDRLKVTAGTNINLESSTKNAVFNNFAGDFVLEYQLNKEGNYTLKAFRKTSNNRILDDNASKNGVSFTASKEFGRIKRKKED